MSVDMKPPRKAPPRTKSGGSTLLGLFIGLVVGMVVVAAVVWYVNRVPLPFTTTGQQPKLPAPVSDAPPQQASAATPEMPALAPAPVPLPGKPGDSTAPEKPRFDFYKILPGKAEAIPDPTGSRPADDPAAVAALTDRHASGSKPIEAKPLEAKPIEAKPLEAKPLEARPAEIKPVEIKPTEIKPADSGKTDREANLKQAIYLQAGSFQSVSEADNQKARLAMLGVEARIQQVMLQDKVWYRVRLGPYVRMDDVNGVRGELARQGIDARVVKKD
ncbi:SPOR domain-containing protein [Candidatus Accumulibacter sp. ACC003]|uniref:SPOR domain-containing protein n=1 Tax=Candidatus Accumulibacter sp. ACC003 TaxID=2823334 RepID=UPI0025BD3804|nr:SPOR domain-containing protein [Candidatus Accumulibacter sp. ACC003]